VTETASRDKKPNAGNETMQGTAVDTTSKNTTGKAAKQN